MLSGINVGIWRLLKIFFLLSFLVVCCFYSNNVFAEGTEDIEYIEDIESVDDLEYIKEIFSNEKFEISIVEQIEKKLIDRPHNNPPRPSPNNEIFLKAPRKESNFIFPAYYGLPINPPPSKSEIKATSLKVICRNTASVYDCSFVEQKCEKIERYPIIYEKY